MGRLQREATIFLFVLGCATELELIDRIRFKLLG